MALLQLVCAFSLTRVLRSSRSLSLIPSRALSVSVVSSSSRVSHVDSHVLLGMSEQELQQLALDLGQQSYRGKQLHHLLYKRKAKDIQDFSHLPQAFRNDLQEAGWRVGRSPIHRSVAAGDGTIKKKKRSSEKGFIVDKVVDKQIFELAFEGKQVGQDETLFLQLLIKLEDNRLVETVGIPVEDENGFVRLTACISSQVGCPLRCSFCATGKGGFSRNLQRHEIVEQVLAIEELFNHRVTNVVFMGMGEPMLNMKSVLEAHRCLNKDIQIGQRMITISTVGVPNTIQKLATHKLQSTLAVSLRFCNVNELSNASFHVSTALRYGLYPPSLQALLFPSLWPSALACAWLLPTIGLHAPNQKLREKIVPSAKSYPLDALMKDCKDYFLKTSRRVSFEYTLLAGVNDTVEHAVELAELLHRYGRGYHVNLIPFNPIEGSEYRRPYKKSMLAFAAALESRKITVSIRQTRGLDASAACGQLRNEFQKSPLLGISEIWYSPPYHSPPRRGYGVRGRSPPRRGYEGGYGRRIDSNHGSLLVRNIPLNCRPEELRGLFERFGIVRDVYLPKDYYTGEPRGFAFVQFVDPMDALEAQRHMDGQSFAGRQISVVIAAETRKRPEEMRRRTRVASYSVQLLFCTAGRSRSRSLSPRYPSGSRSRYRSRSYSPARRQGDYSVSPARKYTDHPRSPRDAPPEQDGYRSGRSYSPPYEDGPDHNRNGNGYVEKSTYKAEEGQERWKSSPGRASRSPSGSRSRSADMSPGRR
ncbi:RNA recognition motif domain [Dillenia turbinata]|uniref:RNA recognition motif domain n=1 Tax=Dillenia turbinata TaxID=194707 RepID=A0AAN8V898_9MAGN